MIWMNRIRINRGAKYEYKGNFDQLSYLVI